MLTPLTRLIIWESLKLYKQDIHTLLCTEVTASQLFYLKIENEHKKNCGVTWGAARDESGILWANRWFVTLHCAFLHTENWAIDFWDSTKLGWPMPKTIVIGTSSLQFACNTAAEHRYFNSLLSLFWKNSSSGKEKSVLSSDTTQTTEDDASNNSSVVACVLISTGMCLPSPCLAMTRGIHIPTCRKSRPTTEELLEAVFSLRSDLKTVWSGLLESVKLQEASDSKIWSLVMWDLQPRITLLAGTSSSSAVSEWMSDWVRTEVSSQSHHAETWDLEDLISELLLMNDDLCSTSLTATFRPSGVTLHFALCLYVIFLLHYSCSQDLWRETQTHKRTGSKVIS